jgi:hypothetical protein
MNSKDTVSSDANKTISAKTANRKTPWPAEELKDRLNAP